MMLLQLLQWLLLLSLLLLLTAAHSGTLTTWAMMQMLRTLSAAC
jgi:hypothetical protein